MVAGTTDEERSLRSDLGRKTERDRRAESVVLRPGNDAEEFAARIERRDAIGTLVRNIEVMGAVARPRTECVLPDFSEPSAGGAAGGLAASSLKVRPPSATGTGVKAGASGFAENAGTNVPG